MSVMHDNHDLREASTASLGAVAVILVASALAFTALTAPVATLLGAGAGAVPGCRPVRAGRRGRPPLPSAG